MQPAYFLVFDGLADWEAGLALAEINRAERFHVVTVGLSAAPITTMGGLPIAPHITLGELNPDDAAILIIPGGDRWERVTEPVLIELLQQLDTLRVPIAGICGATLALARAGLLDERPHTSNQPGYIDSLVPEYRGKERYLEQPSVSHSGVITASGVASIDFARDILAQLCVFDDTNLAVWYQLFRYGVIPIDDAG